MNRHFSFKLKDEVVRSMNREQYEAARHYVRWAARYTDFAINWDKFRERICDIIVYGRSEISFEDLLL